MKVFALASLTLIAPFMALAAPAIPEPPLILFGTVTDAATGATVIPGGVTWQVTSGSTVMNFASGSALAPTIISNEGTVYYHLSVPLETRTVQGASGATGLVATPNTLPLSSTGTNLSLVPTVNGLTASVASIDGVAAPAGTTPLVINDLASAASHILRVDLRLHENAFSLWVVQKLGTANPEKTAPTADPDGDSATNDEEYIAGTDPSNPYSTFKRPSLVRQPNGDLAITFATVPGRIYVLEQSNNLTTWTPTGISYTALGTSHTLTVTPVLTPASPKVFYRLTTTFLEVQQIGQTYAVWSAQKFGSSDSPLAQPEADPDGDGNTNENEFAAGTNPDDPTSFFKNTSVAPQPGGSLALTFATIAGKTYTLQQSTDLTSWTSTGTSTTATTTSTTLVVTPALSPINPRIYYRLSTSVP